MPRVFMFDFDGVIADSLDVFYVEFSAAVRSLGYKKLDSRDALLKLFEGNVIAQLIKEGFPVWKLKKLGKTFAPQIAEASMNIEPFPGMPKLINRLAREHPLYIITSNTTEAVEAALDRFGIEGVCDVLGADKESSKVKKIKKVRKRYRGHTPWYIGDTKGDMLEGNSAGARTIGVTWGWHSESTLLEGDPDHLVQDQKELRKLLLAPREN